MRPNTFALSTNSIQSDCQAPVLAPVLAPTTGAILVSSLAPVLVPSLAPTPAPSPAPNSGPNFLRDGAYGQKSEIHIVFLQISLHHGWVQKFGAGIGAGIGGRDCSTVSAAIGVAASSSLRCDRPVAGASLPPPRCRRPVASAQLPAPGFCRPCCHHPVATAHFTPPLCRPGACDPVGSALLSLPSCRRPNASSQMPLSRGCRSIGQPWPALAIGLRNKIIS